MPTTDDLTTNGHVTEHRARSASRFSTVPLGVIVTTFFMPMVEFCGDGKSERPLHYVLSTSSDPAHGLWLVVPFLLALVLAVGAIVALRGGTCPGSRARPILHLANLLGVASNAYVAWMNTGPDRSPFERHWTLVAGAAAVAGAVAMGFGMRAFGWRRWLVGTGVAVIASVPLVWIILTSPRILYGGYLFLGSLALVAGAVMWGLLAPPIRL